MKVLMIGNSFSQSVLEYLPQMVDNEKKHSLFLVQLYIGGCSLERHIEELKKAEADSLYKPYWTNYNELKEASLPDLISAEKWDIVTIQQASHESWDKSKTQPFADQLIAYVRKNAPQAEIIIHQTWAYRCSDCRIGGNQPLWGFDQNEMYRRLTDNYLTLAKEYGFRVIPMGFAVQIFREDTPITYHTPEPQEYNYPELPDNSGDVVGNASWIDSPENAEKQLKIDHIHLNKVGSYLQACVWYGFLFHTNPNEITFTPDDFTEEMVKLLRNCAAKALEKPLA